jgi:hypothetical protein
MPTYSKSPLAIYYIQSGSEQIEDNHAEIGRSRTSHKGEILTTRGLSRKQNKSTKAIVYCYILSSRELRGENTKKSNKQSNSTLHPLQLNTGNAGVASTPFDFTHH